MNPGLLLGGVGLAVALGLWTRRQGTVPWGLRLGLVVVLGASEALELSWPALTQSWSWSQSLPLQLSDAACLVTIGALCLPGTRFPAQLAYCWGAWCGLLALTFPAVGAGPASPLYVAFFGQHIGLLAAASALAGGGKISLQRAELLRIWAATCAMAVLAGAADLLTGGNYMFLRLPPDTFSPLRLFGPWPWYLGVCALLSPVLLAAVALPIWRWRLQVPTQAQPAGMS